MRLAGIAGMAVGVLACLTGRLEAAGPEPVSFPGPDGVTLSGELFRPSGPGPFPAIVAMHGCGGQYDRDGALDIRPADWGPRLAEAGFLVLFADSFGSRGLGPQCRVRTREVRPSRERTEDAFASKAFLQSRADVAPAAVSLLGWSNGGSTVLYTARTGARDRGTGPDFARAVAFYPGCVEPVRRGWHARIPVLILIGAADDWTPPEACERLAATARAAGERVEFVSYPGAYHDFDAPNRPVRALRGLAYTAGDAGLAHAGTDPAAREDALRRVPAYLRAETGPR